MDEIETLEPDDIHRTGGRISRTSGGAVDVVTKTARGGDRAALRREAEVLRAIGGSEVVQLVDQVDGPETTELTVRCTGGPSLSAALRDAGTTPTAALQLLASACDLVARLHSRGWAHGRVTADHVLLTRRGRMRLCSLSAASPVDSDPAVAAADRAALLRMVDDWTSAPAGPGREPGLGRRIRAEVLARRTQRLPDDPDPRVLARILRRTGRTPGRGATARWWAAAIAATALGMGWALVGSQLDGPSSSADAATATGASRADGSTTSVPRTTTPATVLVTTTTPDRPTPTTAGPSGGPTTSLPAVDGNSVVADGRRYRIGVAGDVVAIGDWDCDGSATPAVLRPSTGTVHVFRRWATPGAPATAEEVGHVEGGVAIVGSSASCGPPTIRTAAGEDVVVGDPGSRP